MTKMFNGYKKHPSFSREVRKIAFQVHFEEHFKYSKKILNIIPLFLAYYLEILKF